MGEIGNTMGWESDDDSDEWDAPVVKAKATAWEDDDDDSEEEIAVVAPKPKKPEDPESLEAKLRAKDKKDQARAAREEVLLDPEEEKARLLKAIWHLQTTCLGVVLLRGVLLQKRDPDPLQTQRPESSSRPLPRSLALS